MHKGIIAYVLIIAVILLLWYITTGFRLPTQISHESSTTTTIASGAAQTGNTVTGNTVTGGGSAASSGNTSLTPPYIGSCDKLNLRNASLNTGISVSCNWPSNTILGLWMGSGNTGSVHMVIASQGANNKIYEDFNSSVSCTEYITNFTLPSQVYTVSFRTGNGGGTCGYAYLKLNYSTTPPPITYDYVLNGNFTTGTYSAWTVNGTGFGSAPLNITKADINSCYLGQPWSGYKGDYLATTYACGLSVAPGNITSSAFSTTMPFLNFKIISPENAGMYIEILYNNSPAIVAHYNTFNSTYGSESASTFRNASIPISLLANKPIRIRIVSQLLGQQNFIAATGFTLSATPHQDAGILESMNISSNLT